jgi:autotransporter-associated beta strand protein
LSTSGSGKLLTTTNNSYTGDTTIGVGTTLQLGENTATGSLASLAIVNNGALVFNRTDVAASPLNVMALVSGSGTVAVNSGAVQFSNDNTYTGTTTIVSGATLLVGNKGAAGAIYQPTGVGTVTNNGALIFQRSDGSFASPLAINTTISGSGKVTYQSGGVFQANGVNSYSGGTTIQSDTVLILASNSAAGTGDITVVSSGTLGLTGGITLANKIIGGGSGVGGSAGFIQNLSGNNILAGQVTLTSGAIFSIQAGSTLRVNGTITDGASSFGISTVGGGRLELPTVNSYDGGTVISQGTVMVGQAGSAGSGGIQISAGSTLELNSATGFNLTNSIQTAGTISAVGGNHTLSGTEVLTGNTTYLNNGTILTVSGAISDGAGIFGLVSQGTGTLKLLSANSYDGNTQVQQGTVVLANSNSAGSGLGTILVAS